MKGASLRRIIGGAMLLVAMFAVLVAFSLIERVPPGLAPVYLGEEDHSVWSDCSGPRRVLGVDGPGGMFLRAWGSPPQSEEVFLQVAIFAPGEVNLQPGATEAQVKERGSGRIRMTEMTVLSRKSAPLQQSIAYRIPLGKELGKGFEIRLPWFRQGATSWTPGAIELRQAGRTFRIRPFLNC